MRKLPLAVVAASAAVMLLPMASAFASTGHVLSIGKKGGTAVKVGAVLKSGLAKGTTETFVSSITLTCKDSSFSAKVTTNSSKAADESLTKQTFTKCSATGVTVKSITAGNLPAKVTVSKSGTVKVSESSKSKPLELKAVVSVSGVGTISCTDEAASISGKASNTGNTIKFTNQKFSPVKDSNPLCAAGKFSATFGPVVDSSAKNAKVFVN
jgi:hypothetical protein